MKKQNLLKSLILISAVLASTVGSFASTDAVQTLSVSAPPAVSISKNASSESDDLNPRTGAHKGLNASFTLMTNGTDEDYLFDEIGCGLKIKDMQIKYRELLESVQLFYKVMILKDPKWINELKRSE